MNENIFSYIIILLIVLTVMTITRLIRKKMAKPTSEKGVQKPGGFDNFILKFITFLAISCGVLTVLGAVIRETGMAISFLVLALFFSGCAALIKREYSISYQENDEYFILKSKGKEYQVYYENIIDWLPSYNEIKVLDESRQDKEYIRVNIAMIKPEILLGKIIEMTFDGKFYHIDNLEPEDLKRELEIINFLVHNNYGYLIEGYTEK